MSRNYLPRVTEVFAFLSVDPGGEGLVAFQPRPGLWMPMVAADSATVDKMRQAAQEIAKATRVTIRLVRFTERQDIETFGGDK